MWDKPLENNGTGIVHYVQYIHRTSDHSPTDPISPLVPLSPLCPIIPCCPCMPGTPGTTVGYDVTSSQQLGALLSRQTSVQNPPQYVTRMAGPRPSKYINNKVQKFI